jgi:hydrogenase maturation factor HypF (carbamoyltransferase family)
MECANCGNTGTIKYQFPYDTKNTEVTIFCDVCFDTFVKLNKQEINTQETMEDTWATFQQQLRKRA